MKLSPIAFFLLLLALTTPARAQSVVFRVCAIGDSHVEPGSLFVRQLQRNLGDSYLVEAHGRRGWTSQRWLRRGDFGTECHRTDIVLISLGGNDISNGFSEERTKANIEQLIQQLPSQVLVIYHMPVPRVHLPRMLLSRDGVHLNRAGARLYAKEFSDYLLYP